MIGNIIVKTFYPKSQCHHPDPQPGDDVGGRLLPRIRGGDHLGFLDHAAAQETAQPGARTRAGGRVRPADAGRRDRCRPGRLSLLGRLRMSSRGLQSPAV